MNWRRAAIFIAINVVVSATVTLLVLSAWESRRLAAPSPTLAATIAAAPATRPPIESTAAVPIASPTPALSPTASGPFVYFIESGDTLGELALRFDVPLEELLAVNDLTEDATLTIGQAITIPVESGAIAEATPAATTGRPVVTIFEIQSPGVLADETVILANLGDPARLAGWTLSDGKSNRYTFPDVTVFQNADVALHTGEGTDTPSDLYWGQSAAIWGKTGTVAYLRDAGGKLVATWIVP